LFLDDPTNPEESWQTGFAASALMDAGTIPPCALVGLDNNHNSRYYSPYSHATTESSNNACQIVGEADSYLEHIVSEVMPVLGKHFALADTPEKVGLGGAGLGGVFAMHGGMRYPQVFGRILAESPALWLADLQMLHDLKTHKGEFPQRLYMGMGTVEYSSRADIGPEALEVDALLVEWAEEAARSALELGGQVHLHVEQGGAHGVAAWRSRFPRALAFLLAADAPPATHNPECSATTHEVHPPPLMECRPQEAVPGQPLTVLVNRAASPALLQGGEGVSVHFSVDDWSASAEQVPMSPAGEVAGEEGDWWMATLEVPVSAQHTVDMVFCSGDSWENNYDNNFAVACASASNDVAGLEVLSPEEETAEPAEPQTKLEEETAVEDEEEVVATVRLDEKPEEEEEELAEARDLEVAMAAVLSELPEREMRLAAREAELAARKQAARDAQVQEIVQLAKERAKKKAAEKAEKAVGERVRPAPAMRALSELRIDAKSVAQRALAKAKAASEAAAAAQRAAKKVVLKFAKMQANRKTADKPEKSQPEPEPPVEEDADCEVRPIVSEVEVLEAPDIKPELDEDADAECKPAPGPSPLELELSAQVAAQRVKEAAQHEREARLFYTSPETLAPGEPFTMWINPGNGDARLVDAERVVVHYGFNNWDVQVEEREMARADASTGHPRWKVELECPESAYQLDFVFSDGGGVYDNNDGCDFSVPVKSVKPKEKVLPRTVESVEAYEHAGGTMHLVKLGARPGADRKQRWKEERLLRVWTPPGHDARKPPEHGYPVVILNDGKNLFEDWLAHQGVSWGAGVTAARLIEEGHLPPFILVGIDAPGAFRSQCYLPYPPGSGEGNFRPDSARWPGGNVDSYMDRVVHEITPLVAQHYGGSMRSERLCFGGGSFGGICAIYAAMKYPHVFGSILAESPSFWSAKAQFLEDMRAHEGSSWPARMFVGVGTLEFSATRAGDHPNLDQKLLDYVRFETKSCLHAALFHFCCKILM